MLADIDGDGRQEVVGFGDAGVWVARYRSSPNVGFDVTFALKGLGYNDSWRVEKHVRTTGDIDGDGRDDIVGFGDDGVWSALATPAGFAPANFVLPDFGYNQGWRVGRDVRMLADVNGDGKKDIVGFGDHGAAVAFALGSGSFGAAQLVLPEFGVNLGWTPSRDVRTLADVNGDGKADIVGISDDGVWIALSAGNGFLRPRFVLADFSYKLGWFIGTHPRFLADVNGDGKADIIGINDKGVWVALSTGTSFEAKVLVIADFGGNQGWRADRHVRLVADVNDDHLPDVIGFGSNAIARSLNAGSSFQPPVSVLYSLVPDQGVVIQPGVPHLIGDIDGDGWNDIVTFDNDGIWASLSVPGPSPLPAAPTDLTILEVAADLIAVGWRDNSSNESDFLVSFTGGNQEIQAKSGPDRNIGLSNKLAPNTQYCITVVAENEFGMSSAPPEVCARTAKK